MIGFIWRYSHLTLAISSFLFVFLAAITGIILAFEPIQEQSHGHHYDLDKITLAETISSLQNQHEEVLSLEKDHNSFIIASVITKDGQDAQFYINPFDGEKVGELIEKSSFFQFVTNLHRSLFLKSTGRALVGIASLLLFFIAVTGSILIIKRQGGIKEVFSKVIKESTPQYYHVVLSRLTLIPIVIITLTGVYLSLEKFSLLPKEKAIENSFKIQGTNTIPIAEFPVFQNLKLSDFKRLEFPFSEFEDDYFYLKTTQKELTIHQYSGEIVNETLLTWVQWFSEWSQFLHTGQVSIVWSLVLMLATLSILYFMYSGFAIAMERRRKKVIKPTNTISAEQAEIVILVGSETGGTYKPAKALFDSLLEHGKKVFIDDLNAYQSYPKMTSLFVLTATYGKGEAPNNANQFLQRLQGIPLKTPIHYAVVGFGSMAYPDYCEFAIDLDKQLAENPNTASILPLQKIHNQSLLDFSNWIGNLSKKLKLDLSINEALWKIDTRFLDRFTVVDKTECNADNTFLIRLQPNKRKTFESGDLLTFYPEGEVSARYYSIAKLDDTILLSIKKHELGKASTYFYSLEVGDQLLGKIEENPTFHFPKKNPVLLISNGTGIAPFLGMIENVKQETHLLWGGRTSGSFDLYKHHIDNALAENRLQSVEIALSREGNKCYVQELLAQKEDLILRVLQENGRILICGSLAMESEVRKAIQEITFKNKLNTEVLEKQVLSDCY